jgi:hypothetical protein
MRAFQLSLIWVLLCAATGLLAKGLPQVGDRLDSLSIDITYPPQRAYPGFETVFEGNVRLAEPLPAGRSCITS